MLKLHLARHTVRSRVRIAFFLIVTLAAGRQPVLSSAEPVGSLSVESDPAGAAVYVDGRFVGLTPVEVRELSTGDHRVRLVKAEYLENSRVARIEPGKPGALRVRLTRGAVQTAAARSEGLRIVVIEGEDAVNIIQQQTAVAPVVEVRDRNDQPVAGALVSFAIRGGRATFGGAPTLSVTTNAAGQAVASGLTPTTSGALQISATASFQGQTAAVTIVQTNVMTAAEAAASSGAAGSGGGGATAGAGAGAAGSGGGGLSLTTIGIIGGAAAGGVVAANKLGVIGGPGGTVYTGQFSGPIVVTGPPPFCGFTHTVSGTLTLRIEEISASSATGTAEVREESRLTYAPACGLPNPAAAEQFGAGPFPLTGGSGNLAFTRRQENNFTGPNGETGIRTWTLSFTGALNGSEIVGVLTNTEANRSTSGPNLSGSGTTAFPITLR